MGVDAVMIVRVPRLLTPDEVLQEANRMCICLGSHRFFVWHPDEHRREGRHALSVIPRASQQKKVPKDDRENAWTQLRTSSRSETLVEVNLSGRYYGVGYERGDLASITAVAQWMKRVWRGCTVFYGGDSSDDLDEWTQEFEDGLWTHLAGADGRAYFKGWDEGFGAGGPGVKCTFCKLDAICNGGGGTDKFYYCPSCHEQWSRSADGEVAVRRHEYDSKPLPKCEGEDALYDAVCKVALGAAEVDDVRMSAGAVNLRVSSRYQELTLQQRVDLYELAATKLMERHQHLVRVRHQHLVRVNPGPSEPGPSPDYASGA